jgi:small subunit ribosomal protein S17
VTAMEKSVQKRPRGVRKIIRGLVTSDRMEKTITVRVEERFPHPVYKKLIKRFTTYKAHDEKNEAREGDQVEIMETRPLSKTKRWRLLCVTTKGNYSEEVTP